MQNAQGLDPRGRDQRRPGRPVAHVLQPGLADERPAARAAAASSPARSGSTAARSSSRTPTTSSSTTRRRRALTAEANANLPIPIYPATSTIASWQFTKIVELVLDGLGAGARPAPREPARAARPARRPHRDRAHPPPRLRGPDRAGARDAAHARGVRAAGRAAAAAQLRAGAVGDHAARRARCSSASTRRCRSTRTPDQVVGRRRRSPTTSRATGR